MSSRFLKNKRAVRGAAAKVSRTRTNGGKRGAAGEAALRAHRQEKPVKSGGAR